MASERKAREHSLKTRKAILDAAEKIMREEGYAAVSSRRIAETAGLKSQLVYYHFGVMDDLFLALFQREEERFFVEHARAMSAPNPLRALWRLSLDPPTTRLTQEFVGLANERSSIRKEIARSKQRFRSLQTTFVARMLESLGVGDASELSHVLPFVVVAVSSALVSEKGLGISDGHAAVLAYFDKKLSALDADAIPADARSLASH